MYCITVSTNYSDFLNEIIHQNHKFFTKWYIITDINDHKTIKVITDANYTNIEILFFNFKSNNAVFNKGGAIKYAQDKIPLQSKVLLLDSDIYLPDNFLNIIPNIEEDVLYGAQNRFDYHTLSDFKNSVNEHKYKGAGFEGYVQIYISSDKYRYNDSNNCSWCDYVFKNSFKKRQLIQDLSVKHIGHDCVNWNGRVEPEYT